MPHYFASDVHLRNDRPDRSNRFAQFVQDLSGEDTLIIVGDLYDFWFVSRQQTSWSLPCPAEAALVDFKRRGGQLKILSGNHDFWLGPFIQRTLNVSFERDFLRLALAGPRDAESIRLHVAHGHLISRRIGFKTFMESRIFLRAFSCVPHPIAIACDRRLQARNDAHFAQQNREQLEIFRDFVVRDPDPADVYLFGHIHDRIQENVGQARLFVLGDWKESGSYLKIDAGEIDFVKKVDAQTA